MRLVRYMVLCVLLPSLVCAETPGVRAAHAFVADQRASNLVVGTTVFEGTQIQTSAGGFASIYWTKNSLKVYLPERSAARVLGTPEQPVVLLESGGLRFTAQKPGGVRFSVAGATLEPVSGAEPAYAEITLRSPDTLEVAAFSSAIRVSFATESLVVPKGMLYTMRVAPEPDPQEPQGAGAATAVRRRRLALLMGISIGVMTGVGIYLNNRNGGRGTGPVVSPVVP